MKRALLDPARARENAPRIRRNVRHTDAVVERLGRVTIIWVEPPDPLVRERAHACVAGAKPLVSRGAARGAPSAPSACIRAMNSARAWAGVRRSAPSSGSTESTSSAAWRKAHA
ncbi:MAG: hypothetical protein QOI45_2570 [Thermoleophilaceae bacterium]|nr:hypothetical protein [Thermoleophilaceae bacterium]